MRKYIKCQFCEREIDYLKKNSIITCCKYYASERFWVKIKNDKVINFSIHYIDNVIINYFCGKMNSWQSIDDRDVPILNNFHINLIYDVKDFNIFKIRNMTEKLAKLKVFE